MYNERNLFVDRVTPDAVNCVKRMLSLNEKVIPPSLVVACAYIDSAFGTNEYYKETGCFFNLPDDVRPSRDASFFEQAFIFIRYIVKNYTKTSEIRFRSAFNCLKSANYSSGNMYYQKIRNVVSEYGLTVFDGCLFDKHYD